MQRTTCHGCGLEQRVPTLHHGDVARCPRCGHRVAGRTDGDRVSAAALALGALILLVPANLLPILEIEYLGRVRSNTVWSGCVALWDEGMGVVAVIVFLASMAIPFLKLAAIFLLASLDGTGRAIAMRAGLLRFVESIGRWSMLDVFLLAILVALVKLGSLSSARPGTGLFFFAGVVVLTMFASAAFDPRAMWRELKLEREVMA